jgi:membrane fusion protein, multidrug efflux system
VNCDAASKRIVACALTRPQLLLALCLITGLGACDDASPGGTNTETGHDDKTTQVDGAKRVGREPGKSDGMQNVARVKVVAARRHAVAASYSGTAALEPRYEAHVVAKTPGVLLKLLTEEGERIRAGQVLAHLSQERPLLEVRRADGVLRRLQAKLKRSEQQYPRQLIAPNGHERRHFDVAAQQVAYDQVKLELSHTRIVAPIAGIVAQRMVKEGNLVALNQSIFSASSTTLVWKPC